ncbi:MAG: histidine kinase dimerization/phosphoacceptor domain -containing protein [Pseudomonadota bacterium]|nr:histidine kinase dimerization/phosphoacceptor domain -containing protein [Pseudomonadota bacterium]
MDRKPTYEELEQKIKDLEGEVDKCKRMEEALRESEKRFRKIFEDVSNIAVQGYDEERRVTFWNKASEKLYGYSAEEALGAQLEDLIIPLNMREQVQELEQRWLEFGEKIPSEELVLVGKNGKDVPVFSSHAMIETVHGKEMFCLDVDLALIKRAEKRVAASLKEKEVLLREIHHRVKNNMQVIVSLLRMHSRQLNVGDTRLGQIFDDCRDRVNAMSLIHEALYQSEDLARIDFEDYLKKLCRNLSRAYNASGQGIVVTVERCNVALGMDQSLAVGMVISELVANAFKHAFSPGRGGIVSVSLSGIAGEEVELIVADNGKGLPPEIDIQKLSSLGLRLVVAAITRELGGSIEVERNGGTRFIIHFKCTM